MLQACSRSEEIESQCRGYCCDVVKPVLDQARSCYEQSGENQTITQKVLEERLEEHIVRVEKQVEHIFQNLVVRIQEQADTNAENVLTILKTIDQAKTENINNTLDKAESVMKTIDEKLLKQGTAIEYDLTAKLENLSNKIDTNIRSVEENFKQQVVKIQEQAGNNTGNVLNVLEKIEKGKVEIVKNALEKIESLMSAMGEKLLNQSKTIESCLKEKSDFMVKLDNLNNKIDTVVKKQDDQAKLGVMLSQFQKIGSKYYISRDFNKNWHDADKICKKFGANLINFKSKMEYDEVVSHLESPSDYWTSLSDIKKEGHFVSITTGKEAPYVNWDEGEPNNLGGNENCVNLRYPSDKYVMNHRDCSHEIGFICKRELLV